MMIYSCQIKLMIRFIGRLEYIGFLNVGTSYIQSVVRNHSIPAAVELSESLQVLALSNFIHLPEMSAKPLSLNNSNNCSLSVPS